MIACISCLHISESEALVARLVDILVGLKGSSLYSISAKVPKGAKVLSFGLTLTELALGQETRLIMGRAELKWDKHRSARWLGVYIRVSVYPLLIASRPKATTDLHLKVPVLRRDL